MHIFTRDLRLEDNSALWRLLSEGELDSLQFIFVFTPEQTTESKYFNANCFHFMLESLRVLEKRLKSLGASLDYYYGTHVEVLDTLMATHKEKGRDLVALSMAEDYTAYSTLREDAVEAFCADRTPPITLLLAEDHCMLPSLKGEGIRSAGASSKPFSVYTPFYEHVVANVPVRKLLKYSLSRYARLLCDAPHRCALSFDLDRAQALTGDLGCRPPSDMVQKAASSATRAHVTQVLEAYDFNAYDVNRGQVLKRLTQLSPHLKFGLMSIREVYHTVNGREDVKEENKTTFFKQLYWREFFMYETHHCPDNLGLMRQCFSTVTKGLHDQRLPPPLVTQNCSFPSTYLDELEWESAGDEFGAWCEGNTGYPFIDAAMRELNRTGILHNRCRLSVAQFLTKNLLIDWRLGERYFAQVLLDYDPSSNNGSWQWCSSSGGETADKFRMQNPQVQMKKLDRHCTYVKKWVHEIAPVDSSDIQAWERSDVRDKYSYTISYAPVVVDLKDSRKRALERYSIMPRQQSSA